MRLDEKVTHLERSTSTDQYGETTETYSEGTTFWASVDVRSPTERREGSVPEERSRLQIVLRSETLDRVGLDHDSRLRWDGDDLRIAGLQDHRRTGFDQVEAVRVR